MVWLIEQKQALLQLLLKKRAKCAVYHAAEVEARPDETIPWPVQLSPSSTHPGRSREGKEAGRKMPFAKTDNPNSSEAANELRIVA
jgi:hypothetical protein